MRIIAVDDELPVLKTIEKYLKEIAPSDEIIVFNRSSAALEYGKENTINVAFLDINMPSISGIDLAKELKKTNPKINVVFCTAYSEFMPDAFEIHASGYLLKPIRKESLAKELDNLLHPIEKEMPKVFVRTFGEFDVLVDGAPVFFHSKKSKEMLAYLVDKRGAVVSKKDIAAALFEDAYSATTQNYLKKIKKDLLGTLKEYGIESIFVKGFNQYALDNTKFACDLYDYDKGLPYAINAYKGEYMAQYDWAEML